MITRNIPVQWAVQTGGDGLWSSRSTIVEVTNITVKWEGGSTVEITASFDPMTWNVEHHGLIYTDKMFLEGIRRKLSDLCGINMTLDYTEQGMQGDNYVSLESNDQLVAVYLLDPKPEEIIEEMEAYNQKFLNDLVNENYKLDSEV